MQAQENRTNWRLNRDGGIGEASVHGANKDIKLREKVVRAREEFVLSAHRKQFPHARSITER
jgi:hypothetical protein